MVETVMPLRWSPADSSEAQSHNTELAARLEGYVREGREMRAVALVRRWSPHDVLSAMVRMRSKHARTLLEWLPDAQGLGVLSELDPRFSGLLAEPATLEKFRKVFLKLDRPRALHLLRRLPEKHVGPLLEGHPDAEALRAEMAHDSDTARGAMRHGLLTVRDDQTVADVVEAVRARVDSFERLERIFVVDRTRVLKGYLRLRDLLIATPETPVTALLRPDSLAVTAQTDREEVLKLAQRRGRTDLAVVDSTGKLLGSITDRELADIARQEAEEDMLLLANVSPASTSFDSPVEIVKRRLPWILVGLFGSMLAASVIGLYEESIAAAAILATFVPVVMATAGNAGLQAATVSVQAITRGQSIRAGFLPRVLREMAGAAMNGLVVGLAIALLIIVLGPALGVEGGVWLALTCFLSLIGVTLVSGTIGAVVPFLLDAMRLDPAVSTTIVVSVINDTSAVLMFFAVATAIYL